MKTKSLMKFWLLCINFEKFTSDESDKAQRSILEQRHWSHTVLIHRGDVLKVTYITTIKLSVMTMFSVIITSVKYELELLSENFLCPFLQLTN